MRRRLLILALIALLSAPLPAQFFPLPPGLEQLLVLLSTGNAKEVTQLANRAQLALAYLRQAEQLKQEIQLVVDSAKNLKNLANFEWSAISYDLQQLDQLIQSTDNLGYSVAGIEDRYLNLFKGYIPQTTGDRKQWLTAALATSQGVIRLIGQQHKQRVSAATTIDNLRKQVMSGKGNLELLQTAAQISVEQTAQLERLNVLMSADLSSKEAFQSAMLQEKAAAAAFAERFFDIDLNKPESKEGFGQKSWRP